MAEHIREILKTGDYSLRKKLLKKYPTTLLDLLQLQSLGPKKVAFLWSHFKAGTVEEVEKLAREGKLRDLPGFGEKSEENILKATEHFKNLPATGRVKLDTAEDRSAKLHRLHLAGLASGWNRSRRRVRCAAAAKPSATSTCW